VEVSAKGGYKGGKLDSSSRRMETVTLEALDKDQETLASYSLRASILGERGQNVREITEKTGVRVSLMGEGSGKEGTDSEGPMRIVLSTPRYDRLGAAVKLTRELLDRVREKHAHARNGKGKGKGKATSGGEDCAQCLPPPTPHPEMRRVRADRAAMQERQETLVQAAAEKRQAAEEKKQTAKETRERLAEKRKELAVLRKSETLMTDEVKEVARAAAKGQVDPTCFWEALEARRSVVGSSEESLSALKAVSQLRTEATALEREAKQCSFEAKGLEVSSRISVSTRSTAANRRCCSLFAAGSCPFSQGACSECPRGSHQAPDLPKKEEVFMNITKAKLRLIQQKWSEAGGHQELLGAWQVRNPRLEFLFRGAEANLFELHSKTSDVIDAWHGSAEENVFSIGLNGFDPARRSGQAYGAGEYFAKDPKVSIAYARGGGFMFLCKLLLGEADRDHTWHAGPQYYVIKQREGRMQVLPMYLIQFQASAPRSNLLAELKLNAVLKDSEEDGTLASQQRGGLIASPARRNAGMDAASTKHLWLGWLDPSLRFQNDDGVAEDVCKFLEGCEVEQVIPERNGARIGAFVLLRKSISRSFFGELARRKYRGRFNISVDDQQPANPRCQGQLCPRLAGPSRYCRGWNIKGHAAWQWGCPYDHPEDARPTHTAEYSLEQLAKGSAKFDEIQTEMRRSMPGAQVVKVQRVQNLALEKMYEERRKFIHEKQGFAVEKELWHGTSCEALPTLLKHGLQPPSDTCPSDACPVSGGKGLCTTLCGTGCVHCTREHCWNRCHMYGLGVYLADVAAKSHQYVRKPTGRQYSMLWCRVCLGNPYLVEGNLLSQSALHDVCWCQDPSEGLESLAEEWSVAKGHDAYYVKGQAGKQKHGLGVHNNEYIVFQPYQILPLYRVDYTC